MSNGQAEIINDLQAGYGRAARLVQARGKCPKSVVLNPSLYPNWIGTSNSFWYVRQTIDGQYYCLVDADAQLNELAFDHAALATALSSATGERTNPEHLSLRELEFSADRAFCMFTLGGRLWKFNIGSKELAEERATPPESVKAPDDWLVSPDRKNVLFIRDHNLWLRNLSDGAERALTHDGEADYAYGGIGTAWGVPIALPGLQGPQARWSPDGTYIFAVQHDTRKVKTLPVVHHVPDEGIRPTVEHVKIAYPGDEHVEMLRPVLINVETGTEIPVDYARVPVTRNSIGFMSSKLGFWGKDGTKAYFTDVDRYYKYARLVELDTASGETRVLIEETADTHINLMLNGDMMPSYLALPESDEILWYSERSGWAHFYLYDLKTGAFKNKVTQGDWAVREILRFDAARREVWLQTAGREAARNPYYRDLVRVNIDTGQIEEVVSGDFDLFASAPNDMQLESSAHVDIANRQIEGGLNGVAPSSDFAVVTRSRVDTVPESVLFDRDGNELMLLEKADVSGLPEGWVWPEPVKLKAADGETEICGVIYRPANFDPNLRYPVVDDIFSTPDFPWQPFGSFGNDLGCGSAYFKAAALAQLGFIVVQIEGRGASFRSKAFQDTSYGQLTEASDLADHVAGLKQLGARFPQMDLGRVGIYAGVNGGPGVVQALARYPEIYKAGVMGNVHDTRLMPSQMWSDMFEGPEPSIYSAEDDVQNIVGKLLIMNGMLDAQTPPAGAFRLIEALQRADKDFDMLLLPRLGHKHSAYRLRRGWDFLVRHLHGVEPPKGVSIAFDLPSKVSPFYAHFDADS